MPSMLSPFVVLEEEEELYWYQAFQAVKDAHTVCCELSCGVLMQHIKRAMFNQGESFIENTDHRVDEEPTVEFIPPEDVAPPANIDEAELPEELVVAETTN